MESGAVLTMTANISITLVFNDFIVKKHKIFTIWFESGD